MLQAILSAFSTALTTVFNFVPHLVGFLVILLIGWLIGWIAGKLVTGLLRKVGFDRLSERVGLTEMGRRMGWKIDSAGILGRVVFWFIFLIFLIPAADSLGVPTITNTLNAILNYLPNVFVAILALFLGVILASFAGDLARGAANASHVGNPNIVGNVVRWSIIGFACLIALEQLMIAPALITVLFAAIMAGLALAFGLSFGLGGRDHANRLLSRGEAQVLASRPYDPNQIVQQAHTDLTHSEQAGQAYIPSQGAPSSPTTAPYGTQQTIPPASQGSEDPTMHPPTTPPQRPQQPRP